MKRKVVLVVALAAGVMVAEAATRIKLTVVEEGTGTPVPGVSVSATYRNPNSMHFDEHIPDECNRETRADGTCVIKCTTADDRVEFWCEKEGYYRKDERFSFAGLATPIATTVTLTRVVRPIPLYVNRAKLKMDVNPGVSADKDTLKYDLVAGDWLPPHGTGLVADVVMTRRMEDLGPFDDSSLREEKPQPHRATLVVTFPGDGNGIVPVEPYQGMRLRIREAPESGYVPSLVQWKVVSNDCKRTSSSDYKDLCFRIRSMRTADGHIQGLYGKIYGGFECLPYNEVVMSRFWLHYYLNPTPGDRNLEFDESANLGPKDGFGNFDPL